MPGFGKFADLQHVDEDAFNVKRGVEGLGARTSDIIIDENIDFNKFKEIIHDMRNEISDNWRNGEKKTLIFIYYAGHGVMTKGMTHAVCNGGFDKQGRPTTSKAFYPLENSLRSLGTERGGYVIGIFDCCRETLTEATRGGMGVDGDGLDMTAEEYHNFILWFGCPPGSQVDAKSTIAIDFFREMKEHANNSDGTILLPHGLQTSDVGRNGEMMAKVLHQLQLKHANWERR